MPSQTSFDSTRVIVEVETIVIMTEFIGIIKVALFLGLTAVEKLRYPESQGAPLGLSQN